MADSKALELLKSSEETLAKKFEEADIQDNYETLKDQVKADIRKGEAEIRKCNTEIRNVEKNIADLRIGALADLILQLKANEEKVAMMKDLFKEYFYEDFSK